MNLELVHICLSSKSLCPNCNAKIHVTQHVWIIYAVDFSNRVAVERSPWRDIWPALGLHVPTKSAKNRLHVPTKSAKNLFKRERETLVVLLSEIKPAHELASLIWGATISQFHLWMTRPFVKSWTLKWNFIFGQFNCPSKNFSPTSIHVHSWQRACAETLSKQTLHYLFKMSIIGFSVAKVYVAYWPNNVVKES